MCGFDNCTHAGDLRKGKKAEVYITQEMMDTLLMHEG